MRVIDLKLPPGSRVLIPGDIHFPLHDEALLKLMIRHMQAWGVTHLLLIGDNFDCFGLSRHRKNAAAMLSRGTIKHEVRISKPLAQGLRRNVRRGNAFVLTGNHEDWFDDIVDDNPAFAGFTWDYFYGDALQGYTIFPYGVCVKIGKLLVGHGDEFTGSLSKSSTRSVLSNYPGQNTLYGHTHRVSSDTFISYKNGKQEQHSAWTIGHSRDPESVIEDKVQRSWARTWEQGFALVKVLDRGRFVVDQIRPWKEGKRSVAFVDGKVWR